MVKQILRGRGIVVKNGYKKIMEMYAPYRARIYSYNAKIKDSGYYLKPIHLVYKNVRDMKLKYIYFGRYWYRLVKRGRSIKWVYVGREKPDPHLPDPPISPFEGISIIAVGDDIIVDEETFEVLDKLSRLLLNKPLISND